MHEDEPSLDTARLSTIPGIEETAYTWDIASGRIDWEPNAAIVLGMDTIAEITTVAAFEAQLHEPKARWHETIRGATATTGGTAGETYQTQYRFRPSRGEKAGLVIWLDDMGRWWPDEQGRPSRARGTIRVVDARVREKSIAGGSSEDINEQHARSGLEAALTHAIGVAQHTGRPGALLLAGVSNLTMINVSFGVDVGNEVTGAVAQRLRTRLGSDASTAPYSAGKLAIFLETADAMGSTAEHLIDAIRNTPIQTSACELAATLAVGGAMIPAQDATAAEVMSHALEAFERARLEQTDCFIAFEQEAALHERRRNIAVASGVHSALDEGRMHFVLQPIISAETGRPAMYECLLRMTRPDGSVASAGEFIHIAEELGLARKIDRHSLELAVALSRATRICASRSTFRDLQPTTGTGPWRSVVSPPIAAISLSA